MAEIDTEKVYKQLKKQNGERVAKVIREAVLLDVPNIVHILEFAGNNPNEVQELVPVIHEIYKTKSKSEYQTDKDPLTLLNDAGYDAFVVETEKQKNSIKKYYRHGEELCTFGDPHRHENYYIIHAVKRGADKIKPSKNPERQDEYGTSVISIQIAKTGGFISIKNRYNHTVNNPDATFDNNPDNIIPGLSESLKKYFSVDFNVSKAPLPANYRMVNDQLVKFSNEINNVYFGPHYYFSGSKITKLNTDYEIMMDCFVLNTKTGELNDVAKEQNWYIQHAFSNTGLRISCNCDSASPILNNIFKNKKITIQKSLYNKNERRILADNVHIATVDANGLIVELNLPGVKTLYSGFLHNNKTLRIFVAPDLEQIMNNCLITTPLEKLYIPHVKKIGDHFCFNTDEEMSMLYAPEIEECGNYCFSHIQIHIPVKFPKLKTAGDCFFSHNDVPEIQMPNVEKFGNNCFCFNHGIRIATFPKLKETGTYFFGNSSIKGLYVPCLVETGNGLVCNNKLLEVLDAPNLKNAGSYFLQDNTSLLKLNTPVLDDPLCAKDLKRLKLLIANNKLKNKGLRKVFNKIASIFKTNNKI